VLLKLCPSFGRVLDERNSFVDREQVLRAVVEAVESADAANFAQVAKSAHPADIATVLAELRPAHVHKLLATLPVDDRGHLFGYLDVTTQIAAIERFSRSDLAELVLHMSSDERADLFKALREEQRESLLPALAQIEREDIRELALYPEGTVGSVMTSDYATIMPHLSASEAIGHLRQMAPDTETIYQAYVVDEARKLVGTVSLKDLIIANPQVGVDEFMDRAPIFVRAEAPREEAARLISKYDLIALPVVDGGDMLVGIVTYDDAMDVAEAEATEDFNKLGAVEELPAGFRTASVSLLYRKRVYWLVVLVFGNLVSGAAIAYFEDTIAAHLTLIFFLPLLIASSGNAGAQSATLMVRSLATGEVVLKDWTGMLLRELAVATMLGATMALAVYGIGLWRGGTQIALLVAFTMMLVVVVGSMIGMLLPVILNHFKLDPATSSAPLITSIADGVGVILYFTLATALLELPGLAT
jgi:Mg2+ transporter (mgtE)